MWFVFPQLAGLGRSETARFFALSGAREARAFLDHAILGARLREAADALLGWVGHRRADAILGSVDALKLASSMTLFEAVAGGQERPRFAAVLEGYFGGRRDPATLALLAGKP
jgi:uncharacterized protein (DUF1810 family)